MYGLKKNKDFVRVYQNGKSLSNKYLVMYLLKNEFEENRVGISVGRKVGNSVVRHRLKRQVKESFRLNNEKFKEGFDIVIVVRVLAKGILYSKVDSALLHLGKLHGILKEGHL